MLAMNEGVQLVGVISLPVHPVAQPAGLSPAPSCLARPRDHAWPGAASALLLVHPEPPFIGCHSSPPCCPASARAWARLGGGHRRGGTGDAWGEDLGLRRVFIHLSFHAVMELNVNL